MFRWWHSNPMAIIMLRRSTLNSDKELGLSSSPAFPVPVAGSSPVSQPAYPDVQHNISSDTPRSSGSALPSSWAVSFL